MKNLLFGAAHPVESVIVNGGALFLSGVLAIVMWGNPVWPFILASMIGAQVSLVVSARRLARQLVSLSEERRTVEVRDMEESPRLMADR